MLWRFKLYRQLKVNHRSVWRKRKSKIEIFTLGVNHWIGDPRKTLILLDKLRSTQVKTESGACSADRDRVAKPTNRVDLQTHSTIQRNGYRKNRSTRGSGEENRHGGITSNFEIGVEEAMWVLSGVSIICREEESTLHVTLTVSSSLQLSGLTLKFLRPHSLKIWGREKREGEGDWISCFKNEAGKWRRLKKHFRTGPDRTLPTDSAPLTAVVYLQKINLIFPRITSFQSHINYNHI